MAALALLVAAALASVPTSFSQSGFPSAPSRAEPLAGRVFVGAYAGFPQPQYTHVLSVGCRVRLWNRAHTAARQLKPIIRRHRREGAFGASPAVGKIPLAAA